MNLSLFMIYIFKVVLNIPFGSCDNEKMFRSDNCPLVGDSDENVNLMEVKPKIVQGFEVKDMGLFAYQVDYAEGCGGSILGKYWVITAAHCGKRGYVRVGSRFINKGHRHEVKEYFPHPTYVENATYPPNMDIMLLKLGTSIKINYSARPIQIGRVEDLTIGKMLTVSGWGLYSYGGERPSTLQAALVPIVSKKTCLGLNKHLFNEILTNNMFCAGFLRGGKDPCQGDSGGPAVADNRLYGIISFGSCGASPGHYAVYVKIGVATQWIQNVTKLKVT